MRDSCCPNQAGCKAVEHLLTNYVDLFRTCDSDLCFHVVVYLFVFELFLFF